MKYYASWLLAGVFGYIIAWWFWGLIGLVAAIAVFMLLPVAVPERIRAAVAGLVLMLGAIVSAGSWGIDHGILTERMKWSRIVAKEQLRLKLEADANLKAEQQRADSAELHTKILQGQLDAIDNEATPEAPANCGTVVPESTARKLHDLTGRRR